MNRYLELQKEAGEKAAQHFNRTAPRVRQGKTRAAKFGYRPTYSRAAHDVPGGARR